MFWAELSSNLRRSSRCIALVGVMLGELSAAGTTRPEEIGFYISGTDCPPLEKELDDT